MTSFGHSEPGNLTALPGDWAQVEEPVEEPKTYVTFDMGEQTFAVEVRSVREILDLQRISRLPNAPSDVMGVIDVRGEGIAVVDLAARLGIRLGGRDGEGRIIVFELEQGAISTPIGVTADRVLSVVEIADAEIEATPSTLTAWNSTAVQGVTRLNGALTMVLDLSAVFDLGVSAPGPFDFS